MYILITYDVALSTETGAKRLRKVAKACMNFGQRVQNSVFECSLTQAQFLELRHQLISLIDAKQDSIRFYFLGNNWENKIEQIGKPTSYNVNNSLII